MSLYLINKELLSEKSRRFTSLNEIICSLGEVLKPPENYTVSQAAEKWRFLNNPGAYVGPWHNWAVYSLVEPQDTIMSRHYSGLVFAGPAQTGKTDALVLNALTYCVKVQPLDMMLVSPTHTDGRDFSIRRVDRLHLHSKEVGAMLASSKDADNKFDKSYTNGMLFTIGWPTKSQVAGKPIPIVVITDRDRMPDDIDGDGEIFDLASKRTETFGSYAMTVAESSPSKPIINPKYIKQTPHEAPPCEGILKLYNRGDRRRWNWPCPSCNRYFEGTFEMLVWDSTTPDLTNMERGATVRMQCPHCPYLIHFDERLGMEQWGIWLKDGQGIDEKGRVFGKPPKTKIASFWLTGVAAAFNNWMKLVTAFLDMTDEYERTGSEEGLKKFYNNDLGLPYLPKSMMDDLRTPEELKARADKYLPEREVPANVRFMVAICDVQKNMWKVQVFGIMPGIRFDMVTIDRFDVFKSQRLDEDGERKWVKPGTYLEDWDELVEHVMEKQYPLGDGSGRKMAIRFVGCDSGGKAGVTGNAYNFYRKLKTEGKANRFVLIKGEPKPNQPRTRIGLPDSNRKDKLAVARGDVPVLFLNSNLLKDDLNGRLDCLEPGKGMYITPGWLSDSFYAELCVEVRTAKGWENLNGYRNETWDLSYYCIGLCISKYVGVESINWEKPPSWAAEWDQNDMVSKAEAKARFAPELESNYDFASFGKALG